MITKADIIAMARRVARRSAGYPDRRMMHPSRDWLIGLAIATVLFLCVSSGAGYLFLRQSAAVDDTYEAEVETVSYDQRRIDRVLERYERRAVQFGALRGDPVQGARGAGSDEGDAVPAEE